MAAAAALADRAAATEREVSHKTDPRVAIEQSPVDMSDDSDSQVKLFRLISKQSCDSIEINIIMIAITKDTTVQ